MAEINTKSGSQLDFAVFCSVDFLFVFYTVLFNNDFLFLDNRNHINNTRIAFQLY